MKKKVKNKDLNKTNGGRAPEIYAPIPPAAEPIIDDPDGKITTGDARHILGKYEN